MTRAEQIMATAEWRSPDSLTPYVTNNKKHPIQQIDKLAAMIAEFGFDQPIVVDGAGVIIKGHCRREAALRLKLDVVPVLVRTDLTAAQIKAARIADNKIAESEWDIDALKIEFGALSDMDYDLGLTGFTGDELDALLAEKTEGLTDPDDVPDAPAEPVTVLGDVWVLGKHRLACGDSTDALVVEKVLAGVKPHLMVTDPPYGVAYDASWRSEAGKTSPGMKTTPQHVHAKGRVENDDKADWSEAWALFPGDVAYVWHAGLFAGAVADSLTKAGFAMRSQIMWAKQQFAIGRGDYHWQHEPCWYAVRSGRTGHYGGDRKQSTLWQIDKPRKSETGHSTQKPVECMKRPIENNSSPGQAVYEPFSGSGTTIIAGEMTGRSVHAIELSPQYVDVAVTRWMAFTGQQATLEGDGRTFAEISAERAP